MASSMMNRTIAHGLLLLTCAMGHGKACAAAIFPSPTFSQCPITTDRISAGLDNVAYSSQKASFYRCPPCTYISLIAVAPSTCLVNLILDVVCSDGSAPKTSGGFTLVNPLGYAVYATPPETQIFKSPLGFTRAFLKKTIVPRNTGEVLGRGHISSLELVRAGGKSSVEIGGVFPDEQQCADNYVKTTRSDKVVCDSGSRIVGIRGDDRSGPVFNVDFICGKVTQCSNVFSCPAA